MDIHNQANSFPSLALLVWLVMCCFSTNGHATPHPLTEPTLMVVGVKINQQVVADWDVHSHDTEFWLPVSQIEKYLGVTIQQPEKSSQSIQLVSPLGIALVPLSETALHPESGPHLSTAGLWQKLKIKSTFNSAEYTLHITLPWSPHDSPDFKKNRKKIAIDFPAPAGSLSFIRLQNEMISETSDTAIQAGTTLSLGGSAVNGSWLLSVNDDPKSEARLTDLYWNTSHKYSTFRVGTNHANVSPLLENHRFTGAQSAWTNHDIQHFTDFDLNLGFDSFLTDDISIKKTISRSDGPPAGIAELRLDGHRAALVRIDLTGQYKFTNIQYRQGDFQQTEIHLYEHNLAEQPVQVINLTQNTIDQMLSKKQTFIRAAVGINGNVFESTTEQQPTGFFQYRYGVTNKVTLHFATQKNPDQTLSAMTGVRASVGEHWAVSADFARRSRKNAMLMDITGRFGNFTHQASASYYDAGYRTSNTIIQNRYDIRYDGYWRQSASLKFGLFARRYSSGKEITTRYVLPGVFGRFNTHWTYYAKPDTDGLYRFGAEYYNGHRQRLTLSSHESGSTTLLHSFYRTEWHTYQFGIEQQHAESKKPRLFAQSDFYPSQHHRSFLHAYASYSSESISGSIAWNTIVKPGVEVQLQYDKHKNRITEQADSEQFWLRTKLNFGKSGRKIIPTDDSAINFNRGGISGAIVNGKGDSIDVNDVRLRVNGNNFPQTSVDGHYYVSEMKPGIYNVSIDERFLPIEYEPDKSNVLVEVRASAITNVDFKLSTKYGFAGQVAQADKRPAPNVQLVIKSSTGNIIKTVSTDQFGYYRVDELPPATYTVSVENKQNRNLQITVNLTDDYLFDQNIVLHGSDPNH